MTIRVLLADDHILFREALHSLLDKTEDIEVVGEAGDGAQVLQQLDRLAPDVVVMDVSMPNMSGIEATRQLQSMHPGLRVIGLSAFVYKRFIFEMLGAGAKAYIAKSSAGEELVRAIHAVMKGQTYLCPEATATLADGVRPNDSRTHNGGTEQRLGRREKEVLVLLADGKSSPEVAEKLHIASSTVDVHRRNIMRKLGLHNVVELTKYAIREGLISP